MLNRAVRIKVFFCSDIRKILSDLEGYLTGEMVIEY
jgi:hypothetical protein